MDRTNQKFAARKGIDLSGYTVERVGKRTGRFTRGLSGETREIEYDRARIMYRGVRVVCYMDLSPSTTLCLPDRHVTADKATDEEIILARVGDESIFSY